MSDEFRAPRGAKVVERVPTWVLFAVVFGAILVLALSLWTLARNAAQTENRAEQTNAAQDRRIEESEETLAQARRVADRLAGQLRQLGERPVVSPSVIDTSALPLSTADVALIARQVIERSPAALSRDDVYALVVDYLEEFGPEDGDTPTPTEVRRVVETVYAANPPADGVDGRGVSAAQINGDGRLVVTYTDGTTQDVGPVVGPPGPAGPAGPRGADGPAGTSAYPFTFTFASTTTRYTVRCTASGCDTTTEPAVGADPEPDPDPDGDAAVQNPN